MELEVPGRSDQGVLEALLESWLEAASVQDPQE